METIKVGDKVNIYWERIDCEFRLTVIYLPTAPGDSWILEREDGTVVDVQSYGKIVKQPQPEAKDA